MDDRMNRSAPINTGGEEAPPPPAEFPPLTKEDLKEIKKLYSKLYLEFAILRKILDFKNYSGVKEEIGQGGIFYNSRSTLFQFLKVLAMTRHELVKKLVELAKSDKDRKVFDIQSLVDGKIMAGMKILDLGSGPEPVFARCCRAMGADVWTVDLEDDHYRIVARREANSMTQGAMALEDLKHIKIDLTKKNAAQIIKEKSLGDFNLVTEANLIGSGLGSEKDIAMSLLKKGGVYGKYGEYELKE